MGVGGLPLAINIHVTRSIVFVLFLLLPFLFEHAPLSALIPIIASLFIFFFLAFSHMPCPLKRLAVL